MSLKILINIKNHKKQIISKKNIFQISFDEFFFKLIFFNHIIIKFFLHKITKLYKEFGLKYE